MSERYLRISGRELDQGLIEAWEAIQRGEPDYQSPYLSPWFTRAVADVRDDVFVTVLEVDGRPAGFFPYQSRGSRGGPVAGRLNDCQAFVVAPSARWTPKELLASSGLRLWDFDHLIAHQEPFRPFARVSAVSPVIDLSDGYEPYLAERKQAGSSRVSQMQRKWRKLLRERGEDEVRFEVRSTDRSALSQVIAWKIEQCDRTGTYAYFREPWAVDLVERLLSQEAPGCRGALSTLWVGDELAAAHFGMTSRDVWHWWFPTYSETWGPYSPGGLLLLGLCDHVGSAGAEQSVIDLGKGDDPYKSSFANGSYPLWEGHVARGSLYATVRTMKRAARGWARRSPLLAPVRSLRNRIKGRPG